MKKVAILGGTFNPIHNGHLAMAEVVRDQLSLDQVVFVPSYLPPHKTSLNVVPALNRLAMVKLAIEGNKDFSSSDCELKRGGKSYTIDTIRFFYEKFPKGTKFFFIIGEDSLSTLPRWKQFDKLTKLVTFVVVNRPKSLKVRPAIKVRFVTMPGLEISSSFVRQRIAEKKTVKYFICDKVLEYIKQHKLYQ